MKERCPIELESTIGPHGCSPWFDRCGKAVNHEGPCNFNMSFEERVTEGTAKVDVEAVIRLKRAEIANLNQEIARLEGEIGALLESELSRVRETT